MGGNGRGAYLHNLRQIRARLRKNSLDVVDAGLRLLSDGASDEITVLVSGDAARDEDVGACDYRVGLCSLLERRSLILMS